MKKEFKPTKFYLIADDKLIGTTINYPDAINSKATEIIADYEVETIKDNIHFLNKIKKRNQKENFQLERLKLCLNLIEECERA